MILRMILQDGGPDQSYDDVFSGLVRHLRSHHGPFRQRRRARPFGAEEIGKWKAAPKQLVLYLAIGII